MDLHILKSLQDNLASLTAASSSNLLNPQAVPDPFLNSFDSSDATNSEAEEPDADYKKKRGKLSSSSKKIRKENTRREKYNVIPNDLRLELIDCVINKGEKIKRAATRLGINYSSAKSIFQVYKKEGRSDKKCSKKNIQKERASPKSNFTNVPANNLAFPLLEEPKTKTENLLPNSLLEAFKSSQGTVSKSADLSLLNIVKSESAPNYSGSELNLTRKHSMEVEANKGFGVIPPPSGQLGTKVTPNNNFLSNNSAFSKFPRNNSAFSPASTQSSFNLLSPKPILRDQQNILKEVSGNKSQDYGSSKGSFLNSSSTLAQNQSFKLYKGNEQGIGDQDDRQTQLIKQMSEEERQTLMRTLRYLIPQSDLIHSGFTQNNLAMEQTIHIPPLDLRLRSQE